MAMLEPKLAILDETDSGLDIDALRIVATGVTKLKRPDNATIVITHYQRCLLYTSATFPRSGPPLDAVAGIPAPVQTASTVLAAMDGSLLQKPVACRRTSRRIGWDDRGIGIA